MSGNVNTLLATRLGSFVELAWINIRDIEQCRIPSPWNISIPIGNKCRVDRYTPPPLHALV
jgi:hypothetical protein